MLRTVLVGYGRRGKSLLPAIEALANDRVLELVGICDTQPITSNYPYFASVDEAISGLQPEIAILATPNSTHLPLVNTLTQAGCKVIKEKPLAPDLLAAQQYRDTTQHQVAVLQSKWWHPAIHQLHHFLHNTTGYTWAHFCLQLNDTQQSWYWDETQGGGVWLNIGWHLVDLAEWLLGSITNIKLELSQQGKRNWQYQIADSFVASALINNHLPIKLQGSTVKRPLQSITIQLDETQKLYFDGKKIRLGDSRRKLILPMATPSLHSKRAALEQALLQLNSPHHNLEQWSRVQMIIERGIASYQQRRWLSV